MLDLRERPCATTGQLLERWRDQPEAERFNRLAATESLMADEKAALRELETAIDRMATEADMRRVDALLAKERDRGLSAEERAGTSKAYGSRSKSSGQRPTGRALNMAAAGAV